MKRNEKICSGWLPVFLLTLALAMGGLGLLVYKVDPMLHFHGPDTDRFYYELGSPFESNGGVLRSMDYDSLIVGTSMAANLRASLAEDVFGGSFVKTIYHGCTYREMDELLSLAFEQKGTLRTVVRSLDVYTLEYTDAYYQERQQYYKDYGYDTSLVGDLSYILDRDIVFQQTLPMLVKSLRGQPGGMISMDDYENWHPGQSYGSSFLRSQRAEPYTAPDPARTLRPAERERVCAALDNYVLNQIKAHPETEFYLFFPPYSAAWWQGIVAKDCLERELEIEQLAMERLLPYPNVHLFSWNAIAELTTDLNNYKDSGHYGQWVSDWMLLQMEQGNGLLTLENYQDDLQAQRALYGSFDYAALAEQEDPEGNPVPEFFANQGIQ